MGAGERLRDLDSRVLPALLRGLSRLGGPRPARPGARLRLVTVVALLSVTAVLGTAVWTAGRPASEKPGAPRLTRVGLVEGQSVAGYLRSSRGELAALAGRSAGAETWALVSFSAYVAPQRLPELLAGAAVHQVYVRAPLPGIQTQVLRIGVYRVPEDVVAGMLDAARRREQERSEFVRLGGAVGADADGQRLHRAYDTAAQVAAAEAEAYRAVCPCVFAAVLRSTAATLARIAEGAGVRAVDPAPEVTALGEVEFRPPLPEQLTDGPGTPDAPAPTSSAPTPPAAGPAVSGGAPPARRSSAWSPPAVTSASPGNPGRGSTPPARPASPHTAVPSALPTDSGAATPSVAAGASRAASGR